MRLTVIILTRSHKQEGNIMLKPRLLLAALCGCLTLIAPTLAQSKQSPADKFRQLEEILPTPNEQRTASGAPGHKYWQQRADHTIDVELDDVNQRISGAQTITYYNNSPDTLSYLWLQLDQNLFQKGSDADLTSTAPQLDRVPLNVVESLTTLTMITATKSPPSKMPGDKHCLTPSSRR
jgi:predicted secreted protein